MAIRNELIEELLSGKDPQEVFAQDGLLDELKKALAERILNAEMDQHLVSERSTAAEAEPRNHRNGHSRKTVLTGTGKLELQVPRDRQASSISRRPWAFSCRTAAFCSPIVMAGQLRLR
jgi:putative transposase